MNKRTKGSPPVQHVGLAGARKIFQSGAPRLMGMRLISISLKRVKAEMRVDKRFHISPQRRVYGGSIMAFADVVGAAGTVANLRPGFRTGTLESKTNFLAPGVGPALTAVSIPLHIGRTTAVWQTTVRNPNGRAIAIVTQTQLVLPVREP
jgi:uncharacterized protein (TIGR00369 family)